MKYILAVTGTRADYGIYKPVFDALEQGAGIRLGVAAVGMHLLTEFGHTVDQIRDDGFALVAELATMTTEDTVLSMAQYVGRSTEAFAELFAKEKPDYVFVLGDRGEMLAAATAAMYLRIPVIQLHAGEHSGSVDDPVRHAITQLSAVHLCTTEAYADNVRQMCPKAEHVYTVGAPALDTVLSFTPIPVSEILSRFGFDPAKKLVLFVQHPDTTDSLSAREQLLPSINALASIDENILIIGSNADAGGIEMNAMLRTFADKHERVHYEVSLPHTEFLSCEQAADVLVGNSSSGIIEAASFGLPVVNIGNRQQDRLRSGNVVDVPYGEQEITAALQKALQGKLECTNIYGNGTAAPRIAEILTRL